MAFLGEVMDELPESLSAGSISHLLKRIRSIADGHGYKATCGGKVRASQSENKLLRARLLGQFMYDIQKWFIGVDDRDLDMVNGIRIHRGRCGPISHRIQAYALRTTECAHQLGSMRRKSFSKRDVFLPIMYLPEIETELNPLRQSSLVASSECLGERRSSRS